MQRTVGSKCGNCSMQDVLVNHIMWGRGTKPKLTHKSAQDKGKREESRGAIRRQHCSEGKTLSTNKRHKNLLRT